jgi:transcriptional regulator with XRE-family HTH domain
MNMTFPGMRISSRRRALHISQEKLAETIGSDQKQISRYENNVNIPTSEVLARIAIALETTMDYLQGLTDIPDRPLRGVADLSEDEKHLIVLYRQKEPRQREKVITLMEVV